MCLASCGLNAGFTSVPGPAYVWPVFITVCLGARGQHSWIKSTLSATVPSALEPPMTLLFFWHRALVLTHCLSTSGKLTNLTAACGTLSMKSCAQLESSERAMQGRTWPLKAPWPWLTGVCLKWLLVAAPIRFREERIFPSTCLLYRTRDFCLHCTSKWLSHVDYAVWILGVCGPTFFELHPPLCRYIFVSSLPLSSFLPPPINYT